MEKILPTLQQTALFVITEFQKIGSWFPPSQIEGIFPWRGHQIETVLESPSREERVLLSDHKLPFCYWSCCHALLNCSSCSLYLLLVSFPDSRYHFLDKYLLWAMISVLHLTSTVWKDFCLGLQTLQWLSNSLVPPFKGHHLSAGLALRMGKLTTCLRSQILEERGGSHKLLHTKLLLSVFLSV